MRLLLCVLLAASFLGTTAVAAAPISNKEIALMLRSGYTSDAVLAEIGTRRALEPLDPATKKSLLDFGASPQLIAALESGSHAVSSSEADQAKQREADVVARRTAQLEQDRSRNTLYQAQQAEAQAKAAAAPQSGTLLLDSLKEKLVGTWLQVSVDIVSSDGTRRPLFGEIRRAS